MAPKIWGFAQTTRSTVTRTTTDPSGAIVTIAEVTLLNPTTGVAVKVHTNNSGIYRCDAILVGDYEVIVTADGFQKAESAASVSVGITVGCNFVLKIGSATTVEVSEDLPDLRTSDSVRSAVINSNDMGSVDGGARNFRVSGKILF